ncbi:hypothetical protein BH18ACI2_BH18ACI2_20220 [soil metagenome]
MTFNCREAVYPHLPRQRDYKLWQATFYHNIYNLATYKRLQAIANLALTTEAAEEDRPLLFYSPTPLKHHCGLTLQVLRFALAQLSKLAENS